MTRSKWIAFSKRLHRSTFRSWWESCLPASYRNAEFIHNYIPGMSIPEDIRDRMKKSGKGDAARREGIRIAMEALRASATALPGHTLCRPSGDTKWPPRSSKSLVKTERWAKTSGTTFATTEPDKFAPEPLHSGAGQKCRFEAWKPRCPCYCCGPVKKKGASDRAAALFEACTTCVRAGS